MAAVPEPPKPKVERAWNYRMFCPACRWTRDFIGDRGRQVADRAYTEHYVAEHQNGRAIAPPDAPENGRSDGS